MKNNKKNDDLDVHSIFKSATALHSQSHTIRKRGRTDNPETIPPPFRWATDRHAIVHSLKYLIFNQLTSITGEVQCKKCNHNAQISFDLQTNFEEVKRFIASKYNSMHDRAPAEWMSPAFTDCDICGQSNSMRPVIPEKKENINWLFMFLGQTLGCCTLDQLKYFCKNTQNHRNGAKDRVLFSCYITICKQLES